MVRIGHTPSGVKIVKNVKLKKAKQCFDPECPQFRKPFHIVSEAKLYQGDLWFECQGCQTSMIELSDKTQRMINNSYMH